jgi:hypothetical protein
MALFSLSRRLLVVPVLGLVLATASPSTAAESFNAQVSVCFSPHGDCTVIIVQELSTAKKHALMQAYSFTSAPIAKALIEAHKRGGRGESDLRPVQRDRQVQ